MADAFGWPFYIDENFTLELACCTEQAYRGFLCGEWQLILYDCRWHSILFADLLSSISCKPSMNLQACP